MSEKIKKIFKFAGITSLVGLISFLSTIFMTNESFSNWKEKVFYPRENAQDLKINTVHNTLSFNKETLTRIEKKLDRYLEQNENRKEIP